jgi:mannose/cellobiose epimerase-like protein (N-acyl-D-glucosamine 2-epimerase family)
MFAFRNSSRFFSFLVVLAVSLCAQTELVVNGGFSNGSNNWNLGKYGGSSSGWVTNGEYKITVATAGSEYWHVQFTQGTLSLVKGKQYVFSFDAYKASGTATQTMQVNIGQSNSPYTSYFGSQNQIVTLTTAKTHYTYSIAMNNTSDPNSRIEFNCGKSTGSFYIDNVSLHEDANVPPPGISISPAALNFSTIPGESSTLAITLSNSGTAAITWTMTSNSSWLAVTPASGSIPSGAQVTCNATASGSVMGTYTGSLSLTHSASNQPSPLSLPVSLAITAGYQPTSPYILHPEMGIDFIKSIAAFRMKTRDNTHGGFYTNIDRQGNPTSANEKALCGQSRVAYAFTRAFMVTGDEQYLEQAHHALKFLYDHGWNNGWYFVTDLAGNYVPHWGHNDWWSFQQHYALVGIAAMVEATGGSMNWNDGSENDKTWLMRGVNSNYTRLWDSNPSTKGYFDKANTAWTNKWGKGFTPTVDGVTTHALLMALMYDSTNHRQRLVDLADNIVGHMVQSIQPSGAGFPEVYNSDWSIDFSNTNMDVGHGYKTAWVLQRAYLRNPDHPEYLANAQKLMQNLWDHGAYDSVYGAPYSNLNWQTGAITNSNKDFWMTEQGLTAGLISWYTAQTQAQRDMYLRVADGSINFFMNHIVDPVYGDCFQDVSRDGSTIVDGTKGGLFTAGYHASELGYYTYLYGSLYYNKTPVQLYYYYPAENIARTVRLTPLAIEDNVLKILAVSLDNVIYGDFDGNARTVNLPAGVGGKLKVTFGSTPARTYTISPTAGTGGALSPSGPTTVSEGASQTFAVTPQTGFRIANVLVDGVSAGAITSYTFSNVTADHSISAVFRQVPTYSITAEAGTGGAISPSGTSAVSEGASLTFTISPATGYAIASVIVDGSAIGTAPTITFNAISANHTIAASFSLMSSTVFQINCGAAASSPFVADQYYSGGTARTVSSAVTTTGVTNPAPQAVYRAERYGTSTYTLPGLVAGSQYNVRLHFAELYWTATGKRKFNVLINGTTVLSNYDVYAATGARYKAVVREFGVTADGSGRIVINFNTVTDNATIEGIEVIRQ